MKIICNNDVIDISKVEYVEVKEVTEYELGKLEEYHGEYSYLYGLELLNIPEVEYRLSSAIASKIEKTLNKYWYEIGLLLPHPKSEPNARKRWEYDPYKRSSFSVGWIDSYGDAVVKWSFTADCGSNPAGGRYSMEEDTELSLRDDIMPVVKSLTQEATYQKVKQKSGYASGLVQFSLGLLHPGHPSVLLCVYN